MSTRPTTLEELLAQSSWLRVLAQNLVAGEEAAEDLVQETWLMALRNPPRAAGPARPWLARVARRLASNLRRAEGRRREHEAGAARAELAFDARTSTEVLEAQRALAEAVLRLEEPLRSAIVLRYVRGLDSEEVGRVQGAPAGTVRWRLKRALELLRADLVRRAGGDRERWCSGLAALCAELTARSGPTPRTGASLAGSKATAGVALALTSLLVLSVAYVLASGERTDRSGGTRNETASLPSEPASPDLELAAALGFEEPTSPAPSTLAPTRAPTPAGAPAPPRRAPIRGRLWIARTQQPLDEVLTVRLRTGDLSLRETVVTAPDGSFRSTKEFPRGFVLATVLYPSGEVADECETLFDPASSEEWDMSVRWPTFVSARMVDRDGNPLGGVRFSLSATEVDAQLASKSRPDGSLRIQDLPTGEYTLVLQKGFARIQRRLVVRRGPNELGDVVVACAERVGEISGELRGPNGPPQGTVLLMDLSGNLLALASTTDRGDRHPMEFRFADVPLGDYLLAPLSYDGLRFEPETVRVSPPETRVVFDGIGRCATLEVSWPDEFQDCALFGRVRGRWLCVAAGLPRDDVERWLALAEGRRPLAGAPPESGALELRFEPGWGHAFLFVEAGGGPKLWVAGKPLPGIEVIADGHSIARSDESGLAVGSLAQKPSMLEFRARDWRVHATSEETHVTVVEMARD